MRSFRTVRKFKNKAFTLEVELKEFPKGRIEYETLVNPSQYDYEPMILLDDAQYLTDEEHRFLSAEAKSIAIELGWDKQRTEPEDYE